MIPVVWNFTFNALHSELERCERIADFALTDWSKRAHWHERAAHVCAVLAEAVYAFECLDRV